MPRPCTICSNPEKTAIDSALIEATPYRRIASEYNLSEAAVRRHAKRHLRETIARARVLRRVDEERAIEQATQAVVTREIDRADDLLKLAERLQTEALDVLERAKVAGNLGGVLQAIDRLQKGVVLLGGLLQGQGGVSAAPARPTDEDVEGLMQRLDILAARTQADIGPGRPAVPEHSS